MYFLEPFVGDMSIDLSSSNGSMTKHGLDASNVRAIDQEICSEAVA